MKCTNVKLFAYINYFMINPESTLETPIGPVLVAVKIATKELNIYAKPIICVLRQNQR